MACLSSKADPATVLAGSAKYNSAKKKRRHLAAPAPFIRNYGLRFRFTLMPVPTAMEPSAMAARELLVGKRFLFRAQHGIQLRDRRGARFHAGDRLLHARG